MCSYNGTGSSRVLGHLLTRRRWLLSGPGLCPAHPRGSWPVRARAGGGGGGAGRPAVWWPAGAPPGAELPENLLAFLPWYSLPVRLWAPPASGEDVVKWLLQKLGFRIKPLGLLSLPADSAALRTGTWASGAHAGSRWREDGLELRAHPASRPPATPTCGGRGTPSPNPVPVVTFRLFFSSFKIVKCTY